jgi:integration host factor subunit beta
MTRSDLIAQLAERFHHLTPKDAEISAKEILDALGDALAHGRRAEIRGFGSFGLNHRPARMCRNPKTGKAVLVAPKYVPHFKPGKGMRVRIEISAQAETLSEWKIVRT